MTPNENALYQRSALLLGNEAFQRLTQARVIILGVGGVGSWCAESLLRSGVRHLTLVDSDRVALSNCNRQLMATSQTVGQVKVEAMCNRLLEINPDAHITALQKVYSAAHAAEFNLQDFDFIIDAIDSLSEKAQLILHACQLAHDNKRITFFSSMGAALRVDPTKVSVAEFWKVKGDPLARALRNKFKRNKQFPQGKFLCVYSEEPPLPNLGTEFLSPFVSSAANLSANAAMTAGDSAAPPHDWTEKKAQVNGSLSPITGMFGLTLAGLVLKEVVKG